MSLLPSPAERALSPGPRPARRRGAVAGLVLACALVLAGCKVDNTPASYDSSPVIHDNFIATCTGNIPNASTTTKIASEGECKCNYDVFVAQVPYDDKARDDVKYKDYPRDKPTFQQLENNLKDDPNKIKELPDSVTKALDACKPVPTGPQPEGTVAR